MLTVACGLCWVLHGQDSSFNPLGGDIPLEEMQKQIRIQVEWIEMPHEVYTELMSEEDPSRPKLYRSTNEGPLREAVGNLVEEGIANIVDTAAVIAKSGQRAKTESIQEFIYPSEYDPADAVVAESDEENPLNLKPVGLTVPANPVAFETRNLGTTLEVDPVIGADGVTIDLNLNPEIVYLTGYEVYGEFRADAGDVDMKMPLFYTMRITTSVTVISGEYLMVGVMSPFNQDSGKPDFTRKVMMFLKADLMITGMPLED